MPPVPDSSMALHKESALSGQHASLHGSPLPLLRGSDPRRKRPAAGLPTNRGWLGLIRYKRHAR
jgi:hypothetical protein